MSSLAYRLCNVPTSPPSWGLNFEHNPATSLKELQTRVPQNLNTRIQKVGLDVTIDGTVQLNTLNWQQANDRAQSFKMRSTIAGVAVVLVGGGMTLSRKSPLFGLITSVLCIAALYFRSEFQKVSTRIHREVNDAAKKITDFRSVLILDGFSRYSDHISALPESYQENAIGFLTETELKHLLLAQLTISDEELGKQMAEKKFLAKFVEVLPDEHILRLLIETCYGCASKATENYRNKIEAWVNNTAVAFEPTFHLLTEEPQKKYKEVLIDRYKKALNNYKPHASKDHFKALGKILKKEITPKKNVSLQDVYKNLIAREGNRLKLQIEYENEVITPTFNAIFNHVFKENEVSDPQGYFAWARQQFQNLPALTPNKSYLIDRVPKS